MSAQFSTEMTVVTTRRHEERLPVDLRARYGHAGMPTRTLCRVADITRHGARLTIFCDLPPDTIITLALPSAGVIRARVMWSNDIEAGCAFEAPLSQASFAAILGGPDIRKFS